MCIPPPHQAQLIAQSIGQAFSVAYQEFLRANGINPEDLSQREYSDLLNTQDMYNDDLVHFSKSENCKDVSVGPEPHSCPVTPVLSHLSCHSWINSKRRQAVENTSYS